MAHLKREPRRGAEGRSGPQARLRATLLGSLTAEVPNNVAP